MKRSEHLMLCTASERLLAQHQEIILATGSLPVNPWRSAFDHLKRRGSALRFPNSPAMGTT
jgi:hypothetical protein